MNDNLKSGNSLRIAVITDSHIDAHHDGGWNQSVWIGGEETLFERLKVFIEQLSIDVLIHCGDVTDGGRTKSIERAQELLASLKCKVCAVRGNHDILAPIQYGDWKSAFSLDGQIQFADSVFEHELCDVVLVNNQWVDGTGHPEWHWQTSPIGWISDQQISWLDEKLSEYPQRPALLVVHYPSNIIPPYPIPPDLRPQLFEHSARTEALLQRHPRVKLVASGHFHRTLAHIIGGRVHMTTAAFSEAPFQLRFIEVTESAIHVETLTLACKEDLVRAKASRSWLNGQENDCSFTIPLST